MFALDTSKKFVRKIISDCLHSVKQIFFFRDNSLSVERRKQKLCFKSQMLLNVHLFKSINREKRINMKEKEQVSKC
jgi:hypothetical protein